MKMIHDSDPADQIVQAVGDINKVDLFSNQVLVGLYKRPEKTASGIHLPDVTRGEDEHQGKVGLVLKLGPKAFMDDGEHSFSEEEHVWPGEWVAMWVSDGRKITINKQLCRIVKDFEIRMRLPEPDMVF